MSANKGYYSTTTAIGHINKLEGYLPTLFKPRPETTLNHKYGIYADQIPTNEAPQARYAGIGIRGCYSTGSEYGTRPYYPQPSNLDLYKPIPFRLVLADEDLTPSERARYRMRVPMQINGINYIAYYLKLITFDEYIDVKITSGGSASNFNFDSGMLTPEPVKITAGGSDPENNDFVTVAANGTIEVTGSEIHEAISVMYGDLTMAAPSELGVYTGVEFTASASAPDGTTFTYPESIYTQLMMHQCNQAQPLPLPDSRFSSKIRIENGKSLLLRSNLTPVQ